MAINFDKALGIHPYALQARVQRSEILAGNLANVDTPGYLARDYDFKSVLTNLEAQLNQSTGGRLPELEMHSLYRVPFQASKDGNTTAVSYTLLTLPKSEHMYVSVSAASLKKHIPSYMTRTRTKRRKT